MLRRIILLEFLAQLTEGPSLWVTALLSPQQSDQQSIAFPHEVTA